MGIEIHSTFIDELINAKIIQEAMLPKERHFNRLFDDYFALYLPQNKISGDFYWVGENHNLQYLVVGDCTGHGVSAALLSILAINLCEYSIMNKRIKKVNKIMQEIDKKFIESFKGFQQENYDNPWIDMSVICIDKEKKEMYFASANRKLLHVNTEGDCQLYKGNRYPIGGWQLEDNRKFEAQSIPFQKGDVVYLGSDGYQDQMGGNNNKKFKSKKLHELLNSVHELPLSGQKKVLNQTFIDWKGGNEQIDDVCIVGVRL